MAEALVCFEQSSVMLAMLEGPDLVCRAMNATGRELTGRDMVGRPLREALHEFIGQQYLERFEEVFATGVEFRGQEWRLELRGPDGTPVEFYANFVLRPILAEDGAIRGVIAEGTNVTDLVMARRAAQEQSAELSAQVEQARSTLASLQQALLPSDGLRLVRTDTGTTVHITQSAHRPALMLTTNRHRYPAGCRRHRR